MNTPTPLIREGLKPVREKSSFVFKVMVILAVHVVVIGGLLLQGCKDTSPETTSLVQPPPHLQAPSTPRPAAPSKVIAAVPVAVPAAQNIKEYAVLRGDTLGAIARKNGITLKALMDANQGINPKRLRVGQKLKVPACKMASTLEKAAKAPAI
jgi:LysM repeat protein